jgi:hypothetical protein
MSALVALLLVLVLPALAGTMLLSDSPDSAPDRPRSPVDIVLSRGLACGLATWLIGSGILTRTVGLTSSSAWLWDGLVAVASLVVLLLPRQRRQLRSVVRPVGGRLAAAGALTTLVFAPLGYAIVHTSWSPLGSTPWYYYGLARQVAEVGSIPSTSIEFATTTPFLNDYHLFTTGTAMLLVQDPRGPITVVTIVVLVSVLIVGFGAVAVASALGAGRGAALLAIPPALASGIAAIRLAAYRPEGLGLGLALLILALSLDWFRRGDRRSLAAGAVLVASLSQVHGIAAVTTGVMVTAVALASLARGPRREMLRRAGIALASYAVAVVVTGLAFREASGTTTAGGLVDRGGLADPTWEFYRAARGDAPSIPPSNLALMHEALRDLYQGSWWWIVPALLLATLGMWRRRRDPDARFVGTFSLLTLLGLAIVASVFMFGWQGYVPRRTGASRIVLEASLLVPPFVAFGVGSLAREGWLWRGRSLMRPRRGLSVLLAAISVVGIVSLVSVARYDVRLAPSRDDVALWRSLPVKPGDVVLANGYTEGFVPDVTAGEGLLDGRAPYTFGGLMQRANGLLQDAHAFFADPAANWAFLAANHVRWVAVGDPHTYALSTGNTWYVPTDLQGLDACAGLQRVVTNGRLTVYRVVDPGLRGCGPGHG